MLVIPGYQVVESVELSPGRVAYRARREADGVAVLIRVLKVDSTRIAELARFKHECERASRLRSSRVVQVHGVEERAEGLLLSTEDARGEELAGVLRRRGRLGPAEFLDRAVEMVEAVRDLHQHGILHRALTPRRFVWGAGGVKLSLFGADPGRGLPDGAGSTEELPYSAPEQTGRMARGVDHRADLYSLGVLFYEMLAGRRPFTSPDPLELIHAHLAIRPEPLGAAAPDVPPALDAIVMKLLGKNAEDRYATAAGLLADLAECRRLLQQHGSADGFSPGRHDRRDALQISSKLYGRAADVAQLTSAFERALGGAREIVLLSGYSGVGKSSLAQEILRPLARRRGFFIAGKYDQHQRSAPYSAIAQAFDALVQRLLSESEERVARFREAILGALGNNVQVIAELVPSLQHLLGEQPPAPALDPVASRNRLSLCFQSFVAVFARREHPLAVFLDDLQWIDAASLGLLKTLLAGDAMEALVFAGAYRENEVSPAHPLPRALDELKKGGLAVREIVLAPLDLPAVTELLADTLQRRDVGELAEVVLNKTGGNPFFLRQFLKSLHEDGAISFDPAGGFRWDLRAIAARQHTSNVVELMSGAIQRLPVATQGALRLAAAIGSRFDLRVFCTAGELSPDDAYRRLSPAIEEGLLAVSGEEVSFAHDKIREAAYALIPEGERAAVHHRIGRLLQKTASGDARRGVFDVVNHLNSAGDLIADPEERLALARMNLRAAAEAEEAAAFGEARRYLDVGLTLLPERPWETAYGLTLDFTLKMAAMESLCGEHEAASERLARGLLHARTRKDRAALRRAKVNTELLRNDLLAALDEGLLALEVYGIRLPRFPEREELDREIAATAELLGDRPIESLADLPPLEDPEIAALQGLLEDLLTPSYYLVTNNCGIFAMKLVQNTLKHGVSTSSISAFLYAGILLCAGIDIDRGYRFGRVGVKLGERLSDRKAAPLLCNRWGALIQHWKEGYATCKESLLRGVHEGLETGQHLAAFLNAMNASTNSLLRGLRVDDILAEARSFMPLCKLDRFNTTTWMIRAVGQICHNLTTPTHAPHRLQGDWLDLDAVIAEARRTESRATLFFAEFYAIFMGAFTGEYERVADIALGAVPGSLGIASWQGTPAYHFYAGVCLTQASSAAQGGAARRYLERARELLDKLRRWSDVYPGNLGHRSLLLSAELLRATGDAGAGDRYDEGIAAARQGRFAHDEALGNELCARYYLGRGKITIARAYMTEAHRLYARWGAAEATRRLARSHPELLADGAPPDEPPGQDGEGAADGDGRGAPRGMEVDRSSVLKASQAISGEIMLPRLLEKLLRIILENAGATRGALILKEESRLVVEAERDVRTERAIVLRSIPIEARDDLPASVIQYAARTGESVLAGDTAEDERFAGDPYLATRAPRSILAAPILHYGRVAGVIYLENSLAASAFTPQRVEVIGLLSSQAAISIENAFLYSRLEEKVAERTAELRAAHEEIVALHAAQQRRQELDLQDKAALIARQREVIQALSTPILEVWDGVLAIPVIGALDDARADEIMKSLLEWIVHRSAPYALVDLTGVEALDERTAGCVVRIVRSAELLGARGIITGIRPAVARTMASLGVEMMGITVRANLREGLQVCMDGLARRRGPRPGRRPRARP
ncbi:protein kinase [Sorangium cellulosum]|uniref:Protein kinase n=1 Tax=Sorangium cellulosum TaxID=56 RepID=A0A2L0EU59_SORCE|nr:AAA family ATPase [Sorangium cellulosum]AUX42830.1 protein kinase [Sorangium cellulosum]